MLNQKDIIILAIESSCDDTAVAICKNGKIICNKVASQAIHEQYGGVVPELASRAHQSNLVPLVDVVLKQTGIELPMISAVAYTAGPGLIGSLMVGSSFAKAMAMSLDVPLIGIDHMQAHILAHFIDDPKPTFPFINLTVSGGHTQLVLMKSEFDAEVLGETIDDAAGEAFDKAAKILGLPYPGGPLIDVHGSAGNPNAFDFPISQLPGLNYSFSGLKTSFLYFINKQKTQHPSFVDEHLSDIAASIQHAIVEQLLIKLKLACKQFGITQVALSGGVSANSYLRKRFADMGIQLGWTTYIPDFQYCTDNAGMIAIAAWFKYLKGQFEPLTASPYARK